MKSPPIGRRSASKGSSLGAAILDGLRRSLGRKKNAGTGDGPKTLIESFRYPRRGPA